MEGRVVRTESAAETEAAGVALAADLAAGDVVLIDGELGAGKTTFVRGVCRGLGITDRVTSPTFTIGQTYGGDGLRVSHLDLYRIEEIGAEDPGLLEDYLTPTAVTLVEWPGVGGNELRTHARWAVEIAHAGRHSREILIRPLQAEG